MDESVPQAGPRRAHGLQISLGAMILVVACVALNLWLFRLGILFGILGLNVSKHLVIAFLCKALGVDGDRAGAAGSRASRTAAPAPPSQPTAA